VVQNMKPKKIAAVVVTCQAHACIAATLDALMPQVQYCIVVDNASTDSTRTLLEAWMHGDEASRELVFRNDKNLGKAQNEGIARALAWGADAVLLMDHDSIAAPDMVAQLVHGFDATSQDAIGMTAPYLLDVHSARLPRYPRARGLLAVERVGFEGDAPYLDGVLGVIASGNLILQETFACVGVMREDFEIDYIDKDFCLRVVRAGLSIRVVRAAILHHQLGEAKDFYCCGRRIATSTNHSPPRYYTIFRNRVRCWGLHGRAIPAFVCYDAAAAAWDIAKIILFETQKIPKLRAVVRGLMMLKMW